MANTGVRGRVVDSLGVGIADLVVAAYDVDVIKDDLLRNTATAAERVFPGLARTSASGAFDITYPAGVYGWEGKPDIQVKIYDSVKRLLHQTTTQEDVSVTTLVLPDIVIPRADAEGWLVTLGTGSPGRLTTGNAVEFLIDNEEAWGQLTDAVDQANGEIRFMLLMWDVEDMITVFAPGHPTVGATTVGNALDQQLLQANELPRRIPAGIVQWDVTNWFDFLPPDFTSQASSFFTKPGHDIRFRGFGAHLFTPMHAKSAIIHRGGIAEGFLIGSPFIQEYFDGREHTVDDPRRGQMHWYKNQIRVPVHDVSCLVQGPAVADIDATYRLHWDKLSSGGDPPLTAVGVPAAQPANVSLQIVRTLPGDQFGGMPDGETGILEAYLRAIRNAEDFIYLENQYFTYADIADALMLALMQKPNLQVIMAINNKVDIPFYGPLPIPIISRLFDGWQTDLIERLLEGLSASERDRIGMFTLWSQVPANPPADPKPRLIRNYIHSKVGVVDDKWGTVGSANLDGVSLKTSQHFLMADTLLLGIPDYTDRRSSEVNAVIYNNIAGQPATDRVSFLRRILWSEHLGFVDGTGKPNPNDANVVNRPAEGWLKLWKDRAAAKVNALKADPPAMHAARILPFPHDAGDVPGKVEEPDAYLEALGIHLDKLKVEEAVREFDFKKGQWL